MGFKTVMHELAAKLRKGEIHAADFADEAAKLAETVDSLTGRVTLAEKIIADLSAAVALLRHDAGLEPQPAIPGSDPLPGLEAAAEPPAATSGTSAPDAAATAPKGM